MEDLEERYPKHFQPMDWGRFLLIAIAIVAAIYIGGKVMCNVTTWCERGVTGGGREEHCRKASDYVLCMMDCIEAGEAAQEPVGPFDW